jgi:3-oxo-5-alpha-steroid 4-dehydrogenase 3
MKAGASCTSLERDKAKPGVTNSKDIKMSLPQVSSLSTFRFLSLLSQIIMDPAQLCKVFFSIGTAVDLGGTLIPPFRERIMNYGSRSTDSKTPIPEKKAGNVLDYISSFEVPHTWFTHYYAVSTGSSVFWAYQILARGQAFKLLAAYSRPTISGSMTANQVLLAWSMMSVQGTRRLYESVTLTKPSKSKMWVGLWAIGIAYYVAMGITVWIEGISEWFECSFLLITNVFQKH